MGDFKYNNTINAQSYEDYLQQCEGKVHLVNIGEEGFYDGTLVQYDIIDVKEAESVAEKTTDCNLASICEMFVKNHGKRVESVAGEKGLLIGLNLTHEDYYYILQDGEKTWYESCVGKLNFL